MSKTEKLKLSLLVKGTGRKKGTFCQLHLVVSQASDDSFLKFTMKKIFLVVFLQHTSKNYTKSESNHS